MKKILILDSDFSEQDSVSAISKNIIASYLNCSNVKIKVLKIEKISSNFPVFDEYDFIVIVHPMVPLVREFHEILRTVDPKKTAFIFHVFGDFLRKSPYLVKLNDLLIGKRVHFIAASRAYQKLLKQCIKNSNATSVCPFPLNTSTFDFNNKDRKSFRQKHRLSDNDIVLLYTGRISNQKNIHLLIKVFSELKNHVPDKSIKLFIFGNLDEFEAPTFYEKKILPGEYFQILKKYISLYGDKNLFILPRAHHRSLKAAYSGADLFVSLSLYHDEDFGYSPLEALCSGTPVAVTKWGGFKDLKLLNAKEKVVHFIDVNYENNGLVLDEEKIRKTLLTALKKQSGNKALGQKYAKKYSLRSISRLYSARLLKRPGVFKGFSDDFIIFALKALNEERANPETYQKFYRSFWEA